MTPGSTDGNSRGIINVTGIGLFSLSHLATTTLTISGINGLAGTDYDSVNVSGIRNYGGQLDLIVNIPSAGTFDLFGAGSFDGNFSDVKLFGSWNTGSLTESVGGNWTYTDPNNTYDLDFIPSTGVLQVISVPEPTSYALFAIGGLALGIALRHRRI